ncbi:MAG: ATP-grasp domain-containing protein [Selenomonadaceae bacterium]|nr:ATP-grasp domain-containing protein [Selenomonadaceae bacterium]
MKDIFLLLGGNKLNEGMIRKMRSKGCKTYVIDWNEKPYLTGDKHYQIDVKDSEKILKVLTEDNVIDRVEYAFSSIDFAVPSVAAIHRRLGYLTLNDEAMKYTSSKSMMTRRWKECGLLNREVFSYENFDSSILELNKKFKLIFKPDNSASSRGITVVEKNSSEEILKKAFDRAKKDASDSEVEIEEYVEGTEFTVEILGDAYESVCVFGMSRKSHTKNTNGNRIASKLHYNAVPIEIQNHIADIAIKCYKALGFSASMGHLEVILKENGEISPLEIGARSSGFIASDLIDICSGDDFVGSFINVLKGGRVPNGLHKQTDRTALYYFYDLPFGTRIKKLCTIMEFLPDNVISHFSNRDGLVLGKVIPKLDNDNDRLGFEILEGPKDILTIETVKKAEEAMIKEMVEEI